MVHAWGMKKTFLVFVVLSGLALSLNPSSAQACARNQAQLKALLSDIGVDSNWAGFIEGHWAKRAGGTGWNVVYYRGRLAFAVQNPITGSKDAQYIDICPSRKGNDFTVQGKILGKNRVMEVEISGQDLKVQNGPASGTFRKWKKSNQQILNEFATQFRAL